MATARTREEVRTHDPSSRKPGTEPDLGHPSSGLEADMSSKELAKSHLLPRSATNWSFLPSFEENLAAIEGASVPYCPPTHPASTGTAPPPECYVRGCPARSRSAPAMPLTPPRNRCPATLNHHAAHLIMSSDLVSVGAIPNLAAKLSDIRDGDYKIRIGAGTYSDLSDDLHQQ